MIASGNTDGYCCSVRSSRILLQVAHNDCWHKVIPEDCILFIPYQIVCPQNYTLLAVCLMMTCWFWLEVCSRELLKCLNPEEECSILYKLFWSIFNQGHHRFGTLQKVLYGSVSGKHFIWFNVRKCQPVCGFTIYQTDLCTWTYDSRHLVKTWHFIFKLKSYISINFKIKLLHTCPCIILW